MCKEEALVSVCIPMYNAGKYIADTLKYVLGQNYANVEVIVVNDHSADGSLSAADVFSADPRVKICSNPGKGACAARNFAYRQSRGKYIMFLDADDFCSRDKIRRQVEALEQSDELTLAFSTLIPLRKGKLEPFSQRSNDRNYAVPVDMLVDMWTDGGGFNCPHCYLIPRPLVEKAGGWDERLRKNQDGEFFSRVIAQASGILYVPGEYAVWRLTHTGISSSNGNESARSQVQSYTKVADIILSRRNDARARNACSWMFGWFLFLSYPDHKELHPEVLEIMRERGLPFIIPCRGVLFRVLRVFLGWRLAAGIVKKPSVVAGCAALRRLFVRK